MADKNDLTTRENEVLALAWQCFDNEPKVDMVKLAGLTGYTPGSAAFTMSKIKRKLKNKTAHITEDNPTPKKSSGRPRGAATASTPKKRKPAKASSDSDNEQPMPSAKKRSSAAAAAKKTQEQESVEDDDEDFSLSTIKTEPSTHDAQASFYTDLQGAVDYDFGEDDV